MREWGPLLVAGLLLCVLTLHPNDSCDAQSAPPGTGPQFVDATKAAGIDFTHFKGHQGIAINLEQFGPGVCVADFDGDGWLDIYFVNGRDRYNRGISVRNALYRNDGDGTFTDVTDTARVPGTGYGLGCVWGDYDNDGHPDLFVTQYGRNVLYHSNSNGTFVDVTDKAGVAGLESGTFHSAATFVDHDRDGYLDLYVGSYVQNRAGWSAVLRGRSWHQEQLSPASLQGERQCLLSQQPRRHVHQRGQGRQHTPA